jgi:DHA2 family multidrug resistance protein
MNLSRNMGGDIGISFVTTLVARRSQAHQAYLVSHTTGYDPGYRIRVDAMARALAHSGAGSVQAVTQATASVYRQLVQQATQLAYLDALFILGVATALMIPIVWLAQRPRSAAVPAGH